MAVITNYYLAEANDLKGGKPEREKEREEKSEYKACPWGTGLFSCDNKSQLQVHVSNYGILGVLGFQWLQRHAFDSEHQQLLLLCTIRYMNPYYSTTPFLETLHVVMQEKLLKKTLAAKSNKKK